MICCVSTASFTAGDFGFRLPDCSGSTVTNSMPRSCQKFSAIEAALQRPLILVFVIAKDVTLAFRGANFEILRVRVVPAIFDSLDFVDSGEIVDVRIQPKGDRALVDAIAGVGVD